TSEHIRRYPQIYLNQDISRVENIQFRDIDPWNGKTSFQTASKNPARLSNLKGRHKTAELKLDN
ncbi:MAG: hypothetical protein DMF76_26440, partial [Acidobacteria bacterium]